MKLNRDQLILGVLAGGLAMTALEVRLLHHDVIRGYWQGWIPIVYGFVSALALLAAMSEKRPMKLLAGVICVIGVPIGLYGVFMHTEGSIRPIQKLFSVTDTVVAKADDGEERESEGGPPTAAPLGITGLSAIGALILLMPTKEKEKSSV